MGIWIRSQDRETISFEEKLYMVKSGSFYCILNKEDLYLAGYSSKEKAMHVLDMVQEKIIEIDKTRFFGMTETIYIECVFEMPKDEEVTQ